MIMKKAALVLIVALLVAGTARAQEPSSTGYKPSSYYTFSWNMIFPMGDFNKWVGEAGLASFDFGGRYLIKGGLAAGFNVGWGRAAAEYDDETYTIPDKGIAITATNYRFTWMVPFQAVVAYHLNPEKMVSPFIGLGIGGDYMEHHLMIQEYDIYEERWDFSLNPEIGVLAKFGNFSNWGALASVGYKWTTNQIEFLNNDTKNLQMLNVKVGIVMIVR
jgi:hypothetical protein